MLFRSSKPHPRHNNIFLISRLYSSSGEENEEEGRDQSRPESRTQYRRSVESLFPSRSEHGGEQIRSLERGGDRRRADPTVEKDGD